MPRLNSIREPAQPGRLERGARPLAYWQVSAAPDGRGCSAKVSKGAPRSKLVLARFQKERVVVNLQMGGQFAAVRMRATVLGKQEGSKLIASPQGLRKRV